LGHASLDWPAPVLLVGHSCVVSWWQAVKREQPPARWDRYRQMVGAGMQNAQLVVAPTQTMLGWFDQNYGPLTRIRTIYNGRDRAHYRVGRKQPLVLTAGRLWDEAKNVAVLARIASRLDWPVYVAGSARDPNHCEAHFPGVQMLGPLAPEVLADWYSRAAIYALPARYEPFGLSALEAAFSGCALVLSDIPTLREVWGDAACFVSPDDEEGWVRTTRRLADNAALRWEYAGRARSRALRYTAGRMAREYTAAYEELCGGKGAIDPSKLELTGAPQAVLDKAPLSE
ncbi:MAG: glycosyltransferase family 4 protein, partial [Thermoguttaceae bacterium]|nr:glycosyltransferase family 4 protein [Thermoguttaceae bacterium]